MSAPTPTKSVWTLTFANCDRDGGEACEPRPSAVYSTEQKAIAALEPVLLAYILGYMDIHALVEVCPDAFVGLKLREGADIQALYTDSGARTRCEEDDYRHWSYDIQEVEIDCENDIDEFSLDKEVGKAVALLADRAPAAESALKRKRSTEDADTDASKSAKPTPSA